MSNENTLHQYLKDMITKDSSCQEIKVGSYYADVKIGNKVYEIQTRYLYKLKDKLEYYLKCGYDIEVIYPLVEHKSCQYILDGVIQKTTKRSTVGKIQDSLYEIYSIREFIGKINIKIVVLDLIDYRIVKSENAVTRRNSTASDKIPAQISNILELRESRDFIKMVPASLKEEFTSKNFLADSKMNKAYVGYALRVLEDTGVIVRDGHVGRFIRYRRLSYE